MGGVDRPQSSIEKERAVSIRLHLSPDRDTPEAMAHERPPSLPRGSHGRRTLASERAKQLIDGAFRRR